MLPQHITSRSPLGSPLTSSSGRSFAILFTFLSLISHIVWWFIPSEETAAPLLSFSSPPILCSSPGVPGIANILASVSGSRLYGINPSGSVTNSIGYVGSLSISGMRQGSVPCAMYPSVRTMTGVMYFVAIRAASTQMS